METDYFSKQFLQAFGFKGSVCCKQVYSSSYKSKISEAGTETQVESPAEQFFPARPHV
jgi:hypothetical protein